MTLGEFRKQTKNLPDDTILVFWQWTENGSIYRLIQPCLGKHPKKSYMVTSSDFILREKDIKF